MVNIQERPKTWKGREIDDMNTDEVIKMIRRSDRDNVQTFTPVQTFLFAIAFFSFGALCMYWAIKM